MASHDLSMPLGMSVGHASRPCQEAVVSSTNIRNSLMRLKSFRVAGLFGKEGSFSTDFNEDINIVTGRNGSGKTSALKLLWYVISGNILLALREVEFSSVTVETTEYLCTVHRLNRFTCRVDWKDAQGEKTYVDMVDEEGDVLVNAEDQANKHLRQTGSSVFLPTFRRIEGGFSIGSRERSALARTGRDIEDSLTSLSVRLSNLDHTFVASLSTVDIVNLLVAKYTELSELANKYQQEVSQQIISQIKGFEREKASSSDTDELNSANRLLGDILSQIEDMEGNRESAMRPLKVITGLVTKLFQHAGIRLGKTLSFGDAATAVNSDLLSAGEKQMLSFIAYNAFCQNSIIIIDEPELSLHVDWQRRLFPILLGQQASNQFLVATHSPFIYSKYPDKEIQLESRRGDEEGDEYQ